MSNSFRGEVTAKVEGKVYTLRADMNFMRRVEEIFDKPAMDVFEEIDKKNSIRAIIQVIHCALAKYHPDATMDEAGDIASEDMTVLGRLLEAASPQEQGEGTSGN
jgi:hypothetical protein